MLTSRREREAEASPIVKSKTPKGRLVTTIALLIITLAAGLCVFFPKQALYQLKISVIRQPVPYTQLFFSNPAKIPSRLHAKRRNGFSFTLVNNEGRVQIYRYQVTMSTSRSQTIVSDGSLSIADEERVTRSVSVIPKFRKSRYLITVTLIGTGQSIHFYGDTP